jgi:hypothetical protein
LISDISQDRGVGAIREAHPDQEREIQGLVYVRLTTLRDCLGDTPEEDINNHLQRRTVEDQIDCPGLSLKSGLHKLSELTKLEELNVPNMKMRIGAKDIRWMTMHWPKLRVLSGLDESDEIKKAVQCLQEHHLEIDLMRTLSCVDRRRRRSGRK